MQSTENTTGNTPVVRLFTAEHFLESKVGDVPITGDAWQKLSAAAEHITHLNKLLSDEEIGDIMINSYDCIFAEKSGVPTQLEYSFGSRENMQAIAEYILRVCGKDPAKDEKHVDCTLPDGSRVSIVFPPAAVNGASIAIRKRCKHMLSLDEMVTRGALPENVASFLKCLVKARVNILVAGLTSSGKTTLLNALCACIGQNERVIVIEDAGELNVQHKNIVHLEASANGLSSRELVKSAMRLRANRIVVGEIHGEEALDFMQAVNSGHHGSMATINASNPRDTFMQLELLMSMGNGNLTTKFLYQQISSSINIIIQTACADDGKRYISHITEVVGFEGQTIVAQDLFTVSHEPRTGALKYQWSNFSSRNPKVQEAIGTAKLNGSKH